MKPCNALSTHYSAFVDGELTPLESLAIRKHLLRCADCRREVQELENMKLAVHMHGDSTPKSPHLKRRLEQTLSRLERRRTQRLQGGVLAAIAALSIIVVVGHSDNSPDPVGDVSLRSTAFDPPQADAFSNKKAVPIRAVHRNAQVMDESILSDLVKRHQGVGGDATVEHRGIISFESLPVRLLDAGPHVRQVVNASYQRCIQTRSGASLAVLDATQLQLSSHAEASLDRIGFYVENRDEVEVRISQSGQRLFVLLTDRTDRAGSPI